MGGGRKSYLPETVRGGFAVPAPHPIFFNARNSLPRVTPSALAAAT